MCFYLMLCSLKEQVSPQERGIVHIWTGYDSSRIPELLPNFGSKVVLQAALGTEHGLLLTEGEWNWLEKSHT